MNKKAYLAPEEEVIEIKMNSALLTTSDGSASTEEETEAEGGKLF